jgi:hypothetical protein
MAYDTNETPRSDENVRTASTSKKKRGGARPGAGRPRKMPKSHDNNTAKEASPSHFEGRETPLAINLNACTAIPFTNMHGSSRVKDARAVARSDDDSMKTCTYKINKCIENLKFLRDHKLADEYSDQRCKQIDSLEHQLQPYASRLPFNNDFQILKQGRVEDVLTRLKSWVEIVKQQRSGLCTPSLAPQKLFHTSSESICDEDKERIMKWSEAGGTLLSSHRIDDEKVPMCEIHKIFEYDKHSYDHDKERHRVCFEDKQKLNPCVVRKYDDENQEFCVTYTQDIALGIVERVHCKKKLYTQFTKEEAVRLHSVINEYYDVFDYFYPRMKHFRKEEKNELVEFKKIGIQEIVPDIEQGHVTPLRGPVEKKYLHSVLKEYIDGCADKKRLLLTTFLQIVKAVGKNPTVKMENICLSNIIVTHCYRSRTDAGLIDYVGVQLEEGGGVHEDDNDSRCKVLALMLLFGSMAVDNSYSEIFMAIGKELLTDSSKKNTMFALLKTIWEKHINADYADFDFDSDMKLPWLDRYADGTTVDDLEIQICNLKSNHGVDVSGPASVSSWKYNTPTQSTPNGTSVLGTKSISYTPDAVFRGRPDYNGVSPPRRPHFVHTDEPDLE